MKKEAGGNETAYIRNQNEFTSYPHISTIRGGKGDIRGTPKQIMKKKKEEKNC